MEIAVAGGIAGAAALGLVAYGFFLVGLYKARRDMLALKEAQQQEAMNVLAQPAPRGRDLLDRL